MIRPLAGMARIGLRFQLAYRSDVIMTVLALIAQVFLLRMVWTAVYGGSGQARGLTLDALLAYLSLANLQAFATTPVIPRIAHFRIRTGMVFFDLSRPTGYLSQMAAFQVGHTFGGLLMLAPAVPVVLLVGTITPTAQPLGYVATLSLGYVISVMMSLLICVIGFWTLETGAISLLYRLVSHFFAGTMVPLSFFPGALGVLAEALPFKYMGYVPAAVYVGHLSGGQVGRAVAVEVAWIAALAALLWAVWRRAHRRVVINGG
ncbi:ABC-2 family transporter protein [Microtetraspora sp. NBRC 16547]|uniref:ABC transporter permease n=1 Tax=Microtetraspora sp. NBRC 16547 TaxID=3030993 RepID=UPI0024A5B731|nr:ABC-2 family transporter protein [Microtetraspora sp. NBRC 16547]GLW99893.1 antibiotic ABC transporter permease [Microtetraspora sp. NBRC 16547]